MTRILVVDDEARIRSLVRAYVEASGYEMVEASTGSEALDALDDTIDLVILDLGLPDMDGISVLGEIRARSEVYVIVLTARAEELDMLASLTAGADDYLTKPFSPRELVARIATILRRSRAAAPAAEPGVLAFDGLTIDPGRRTVTTASGPVELSALDFDLLAALASDPGRVFSRAQLLEHVWGYDFFGDERVVDVHVKTIRSALGDDASSPRMIGTVRGVGYKMLLERA